MSTALYPRTSRYASTKSIFGCSRSTRTSFTRMRSPSRKRLPVRSPHQLVLAPRRNGSSRCPSSEMCTRPRRRARRASTKTPKRVTAADGAVELLADVVLHVIALEPGLDVARRLVGAPLGLGAMRAERMPVARRRSACRSSTALMRAVHEQIRDSGGSAR